MPIPSKAAVGVSPESLDTGVPSVLMENPLRSLRRRQGWTQRELAEFSGVTRHAVLRTEQGVYALPPPAILSAISQRLPDSSVPYLEEAYRRWQTQQRILVRAHLFSDAPGIPREATSSEFLNYRIFTLGLTSRMEFCRLFCVHPAVVEKYEKRQQLSMPDQLQQALSEAGLLL